MRRFLRHLLTPHHTNNYRSRVIHTHLVLVYAVFFLVLGFSFRIGRNIDPSILGFATNITLDQLVELTNQKRQEAGLTPLTYNEELSQAAAGKAQDMFAHNYWAHVSPGGITPWDFILGAGYQYVYAGENLAKNFQDSPGVVEAWMNSPTHRENILRPEYNEIGFAVVNGELNGEETTLVVQMFGRPRDSIIATVPTATPTPQPTTPATPQPIAVQAPATAAATAVGSLQEPPSAGVVTQPLIDIRALTNIAVIGASALVVMVLFIDAVYVWRKKVVRVSGRNLAHILFLTAITGVVWLSSAGNIL